MLKQYKGFTLLELMITLVAFAILAVIAIESYQIYIRHARLSQVHAALLQNAHFMERFYQQNRSFKQTSTTWPILPERSTGHFCILPQGNARGAHDDQFTLKAVAFDKNNEPRSLKIDESLIVTICETTSSSCEDKSNFFRGGSQVDKKCTVFK